LFYVGSVDKSRLIRDPGHQVAIVAAPPVHRIRRHPSAVPVDLTDRGSPSRQ
jgi:hypothetical protein